MSPFKILQITAAFLLSSLSSAQASFDWSACEKETTKFCAAEKDDEKIWACLQAHDVDLSVKCDAIHAAFEKLTGKN